MSFTKPHPLNLFQDNFAAVSVHKVKVAKWKQILKNTNIPGQRIQ